MKFLNYFIDSDINLSLIDKCMVCFFACLKHTLPMAMRSLVCIFICASCAGEYFTYGEWYATLSSCGACRYHLTPGVSLLVRLSSLYIISMLVSAPSRDSSLASLFSPHNQHADIGSLTGSLHLPVSSLHIISMLVSAPSRGLCTCQCLVST